MKTPVLLNRAREFHSAEFPDSVICSIQNQADRKYAGHNHDRHNFIAKERENAGFNEEPVVIRVVHRIAKGCPNQNAQNANKFFPNLADIQYHFAIGKVQYTPAKQETVVHKGLENQIAKRGLTAHGSSGIAHPHNGRRHG